MPEPENSSRSNDQAAAWLAKLHSDARTPADEKAFKEWLASSADNVAAFEAADRAWSALGAITLEEFPYASKRNLLSRRNVLAGLGLSAIIGSGLLVPRAAAAKVYETRIGEQRRLSLDDGSWLFLDAQTRVSILFGRASRAAEIQYGRANFQVAADAKRPFIVDAAGHRVVSDHCDFDIRCDHGKVQVVMIHGEASVEPTDGPASRKGRRLKSGERLIATKYTEIQDNPDLAAVISWQTGQQTFDDTALLEAANEMNRYSAVKLKVDPAASGLKVSGVYAVGDNRAFANSVRAFLPVTVAQDGDDILLRATNK
jgi:transmembrane sensor